MTLLALALLAQNPIELRVSAPPELRPALTALSSKFSSAKLRFDPGVPNVVVGSLEALTKMSTASPVRTFAFAEWTVVAPSGASSPVHSSDIAKAERIAVPKSPDPAGWIAGAEKIYGAAWGTLVRGKLVPVEDVTEAVAKGEQPIGLTLVPNARGRLPFLSPDVPIRQTYAVAATPSAAVKEAKAFAEFLLSPQSQDELVRAGFVSPLSLVPEIAVVGPNRTRHIVVARLGSLPQRTVKEGGRPVRGADLVAILSGFEGTTLRLIGADGATAEVPLASVRRTGGILVVSSEGNLSAILPKLPKSAWVKWIRKIEVH